MQAQKSQYIWIVLSILLIIGLAVLWNMKNPSESSDGHSQAQSPTSLTLSGQSFSIEIAKSAEAQARGLSGRGALPEGHGMLFWFTRDGEYPFWMPDMHFSIDILWINKDWQVVHIEEGVSPESYPATFSSPTPARYVLELPAGTVEKIGAKIGQKISLSEGKI